MYTIINALIVTSDAGYISTQISGSTAEKAWRNAVRWAAERGRLERHVTTASPVFFHQAGSDLGIEQHTIGSCIRDCA